EIFCALRNSRTLSRSCSVVNLSPPDENIAPSYSKPAVPYLHAGFLPLRICANSSLPNVAVGCELSTSSLDTALPLTTMSSLGSFFPSACPTTPAASKKTEHRTNRQSLMPQSLTDSTWLSDPWRSAFQAGFPF